MGYGEVTMPTARQPNRMKKLGIVGGVAWPSTIDYYRAICRLSVAHHQASGIGGPAATPEMTIESLDISKSFALRGGAITDDASWSRYDAYFRAALQRLHASGAELAIIASNTPHNRFAAITKGIAMPVLSIFEVVAGECARLGVSEMLILGTAPTMDAPNFADVLARFGVRAFAPKATEDKAKVVALIAELQALRDDGAASRLRGVADASFPPGSGVRTVCLACTELSLAFPAIETESSLVIDDVRYINTTMIHARAAFAAVMAPAEATPACQRGS
jgi:aspartate racemase